MAEKPSFHPKDEAFDLEIKTPEELEEAKRAAGVVGEKEQGRRRKQEAGRKQERKIVEIKEAIRGYKEKEQQREREGVVEHEDPDEKFVFQMMEQVYEKEQKKGAQKGKLKYETLSTKAEQKDQAAEKIWQELESLFEPNLDDFYYHEIGERWGLELMRTLRRNVGGTRDTKAENKKKFLDFKEKLERVIQGMPEIEKLYIATNNIKMMGIDGLEVRGKFDDLKESCEHINGNLRKDWGEKNDDPHFGLEACCRGKAESILKTILELKQKGREARGM